MHPLSSPEADKTKCLYNPGSKEIVDLVVDDMLYYARQPLSSLYPEHYPNAVIITYGEAEKRVEEAVDAFYDAIPPETVTEEHFFYHLGILPPRNWHCDDNSESFMSSELLEGPWTMGYVRYKTHYVKFPVKITTSHDYMRVTAEHHLRKQGLIE